MTTPSPAPDPMTYIAQTANRVRRDSRANYTAIVAQMLNDEKTLAEIAVATGLSVPTLANYRARIRREAKLKAKYQ